MFATHRLRILSRAFLLLFVLSTVSIKPAEPLPFLAPLLIYSSGTAGGVAAIDLVSTSAAALIGLGLGYLAYMSATNTSQALRVPVTVSSNSLLTVPTVSETAPKFSQYCLGKYTTGDVAPISCASTFIGACSAAGGTWYSINTPWNCLVSVGNGLTEFRQGFLTTSCPSGYTVRTSDCLLSNPRAVVADGNVDLLRTGSALALAVGDLDNGTLGLNSNVSPDGSLQITGVGSSGNPLVSTVKPRVDGGTTITIIEQVTDSAGNSLLQNKTIEVSPGGVIETASTSTTAGSFSTSSSGTAIAGSTVGTAQISTVAPTTITTVAAPAGTVAGSPSTPIVFPTDYARDASITQLKDSIVAPVTAGDPAIPIAADMPWFGDTFSNLLGWSLPNHSSVCPTATIDMRMIFGDSGIYILDAHCQLFLDHSAVLDASMVVFWSIAALFIILGA